MNILYDYQSFHHQRIGGVSNYFSSLIQELSKMNDVHCQIGIKYSNNEHLYSKQQGVIQYKSSTKSSLFHGLAKRYYGARNKSTSLSLIKKNKFDLFHPTYYDSYFYERLKKPFILTVHDMIHEKFSNKYQFSDYKTPIQKKMLCKKASLILANSNNTKKDIIELLDIPENKIVVTYLSSSLAKNAPSGNIKATLPKKYILYVGRRGLYKNFNIFLKAVIPIMEKDQELFLVCTGKTFDKKEKLEMQKLKAPIERIVHLFPTDAEIYSIYNNARVFVFPSQYEGFGIPILEAFSANCPALSSNTSSLPEVGGDAVLYFDPLDIESIRERILEVIYDDGLRNKMIAKGHRQLKKFSWKKTAEKTKECYEKIM